MFDRRALILVTLMSSAGCGDAATERPPVPDAAPVPPVAEPARPNPAVDSSPVAALPDTALFATVRRTSDGRRYSVSGETGAAAALEMTLEDGHRVLFGPSPLEVEDGHFHLEFAAERSDLRHATLFVTTTDGARQWVIPVPADSLQVRFGPS